MQSLATLTVDFHNYWHAGTGLSAGTHADALTEKDHQQLPYVSGRHLKGVLRHALHRAEQWQWFSALALPQGPAPDIETLLFGSASQTAERDHTLPGMLTIGDATLSEAETAWLAHPEQSRHRTVLYSLLFSTAIDELGSAVDHSLRSIEVALPMPLTAKLTLTVTTTDTALREQQIAWLDQTQHWKPITDATSLIDSLGAKRSRGLGEAILQLQLGETRS